MNKIEITNNAQDHIASILEKDSASYFRITVLGGGCAGFEYIFDSVNHDGDSNDVHIDFVPTMTPCLLLRVHLLGG